jgi:DNA-binding transcriptional LysR family regulator
VAGVFLPRGYLDLPHSQDLYRDRWVCITSVDNTVVGDELTIADLSRLPWVSTFDDPLGRGSAWREMELLGVVPRVCATADSFLAMPYLVRDTGSIAMMQHKVAESVADALGIRILELPFAAVPLVEAFWWHPIHDTDAGHAWFRSVLGEVVTQLN